MEGQQSGERDSQEYDGRPPLPPRPVDDEVQLSSSHLLSPSPNEPLLRRKPVLPRRASRQSLEARSYELEQMKPMNAGEFSYNEDAEGKSTFQPIPPKAFHKTHMYFGYDFGYWRMPVRHMSIFIPLFLITFLPLWSAGRYGFSTIQKVNGPFSFDCTGSQSGWSFVAINLRFGSLRYGAAKAIDLAWNWGVGRGLQGIFTLVAYRVFQDALLRAAEMTPLSYELYAALALYSTKIDILWQVSKGLFRYGNWRTKCIFVWLLISTIYLALFPSLMDLCSGYDSSYTANFQWPDGTIQNTDDLIYSWYQDPSIVTTSAVCCTWNINTKDNSQYNTTCYIESTVPDQSPSACTSTKFDTYSYGANLSNVFYWKNEELNSSWWQEYEKNPANAESMDSWARWNFAPVNPENFKCVTQNGIYQWGFSFEWLFVTAILNTVWLYGLWFVWLDCDTNSELCRKGRRLGLWRAIADISEAMMDTLGPNICAYTEEELAEVLKNTPPIKYYARRGTEDDPGHIGLSSRPSGKLKLQWDREYGRKLL